MAHNQPPVVVVNMAQCWQCGKYIPPGAEVRRRVLQTGVAYRRGLSGGRVDQYGPVSLCVTCDDAVAKEERARAERSTRPTRIVLIVIGGVWLTLFLHGMAVPWVLSILVAGVLAYIGVLGRTIAAMFVVYYVLSMAGRNLAADPPKALPYCAVTIVGIVLLKGVGALRQKKAGITQRETPDNVSLDGSVL